MGVVLAAHVVSYFAYGWVRGYGGHQTLAEPFVQLFAIAGFVASALLGADPTRPRWQFREGIVVAEASLAGASWVFLWIRDDWDQDSASSWMFGAATACVGVFYAGTGLWQMRRAVARADAQVASRDVFK